MCAHAMPFANLAPDAAVAAGTVVVVPAEAADALVAVARGQTCPNKSC
jgi:hypothetical protein